MNRKIIVIAHNLRSCHNVGSLLRTAEGLGVIKVYLTGYTPYPKTPNDQRLPHIAKKVSDKIHKTALGAELKVKWSREEDVGALIKQLKLADYQIVGLEQTANSNDLTKYQPPAKLALIIGRELEGLEPKIISLCDLIVEIPMFGKKESFNVTEAASMALYHCRFAK